MSLLGSITNSLVGSSAISGAQGTITHNNLTSQGQWNAAQQQKQLLSSYPYEQPFKQLHINVRQVENGYTVEIGGATHIASNLKEITDLLTNRVAATLLEWNP
jgi:hypothetical protein